MTPGATDEIRQEIVTRDERMPTLTIVIGGNGAGKSTWYRRGPGRTRNDARNRVVPR